MTELVESPEVSVTLAVVDVVLGLDIVSGAIFGVGWVIEIKLLLGKDVMLRTFVTRERDCGEQGKRALYKHDGGTYTIELCSR